MCCLTRHLEIPFRRNVLGSERIGISLFLRAASKAGRAMLFSTEEVTEHQPLSHIPVMTEEVLQLLAPQSGQTVVDMTFGGGGHSWLILQQAPGITLITADRDPQVYETSQALSQEESRQSTVIPVLSKFSELPQHLSKLGIEQGTVDGFLFDLGASSMQFDSAARGFSLSKDGPLDMRMDGNRFPESPTAADVVNNLDAKDLSVILKAYGEERLARSIAQAIIEARYAFGSITRTQQLAQIVDTVFEGNHKQDKMMRHAHPATKVFQALRIFVNDELNELHNGLELAWHYLRPGGRCVAISFHSLEDRIVKRHFHNIEMDAKANMSIADHYRNSAFVQSRERIEEFLSQRWRPMWKRVITPAIEEMAANPRSRSAKLRAAVKLADERL